MILSDTHSLRCLLHPRSLALGLLLLAAPTAAFSQVPHSISYQGVLENSDGSKVPDGMHDITLSIYSVPSGGSAIYSELQTVKTVGGYFNLHIGAVNPFPSGLVFDKPYYLGILIDGGLELVPRTAFDASPYALRASVADVAKSVDPAASGVVTEVNGTSGKITLEGDGSTAITQHGDTITISSSGSGGTGIQSVQNTDGSLVISKPNGPTASIAVAPLGITTAQLANASVTLPKLAPSGATMGQIFKWDGTVWSVASDETGPVLPYAGSAAVTSDAFLVTNSSTGSSIAGVNSGVGKAGSFRQASTGGTADALYAESNGIGNAIHGVANSTGRSGYFEKGNLEVGGPNATLVLSSMAILPAAPLILIPSGCSLFHLTLTPGPQANAMTGPNGAQGEILYIINDDDDPATLNGSVIAPSTVRQFIYFGGVWRIVG